MSILQTIKLVLGNIKSNKLRTFLTMLGIIIGVAAVIVMVSTIQGFIDSQMAAYGKMGINNISVVIKSNAPAKFSSDEAHELVRQNGKLFKGVTQTAPFSEVLNLKTDTEVSRRVDYTTVQGVDENYVRLLNQKIKSGRDIYYSDIVSRNKICVIGSFIANKAFKTQINVGDFVYINGIRYKVVGILDDIQPTAGEWSADNSIYLPLSVVERMPPSGDNYLGIASLSTAVAGARNYQFVGKDVGSLSDGAKLLRETLYKTFKNKKLYTVNDMSSMLSEINKLRATSSLVAAGVGMVSLFVAGIGIMNIMLVSVTERTKEIGIRKSLGAKRKDIRWQFVLEAGITGGLGGLIGIGMGLLASLAASKLLKLAVNVSPSTALIAFSISVGVGMVFGFLPANKAARLNPIDALRSE